jgi:hypothetical protein
MIPADRCAAIASAVFFSVVALSVPAHADDDSAPPPPAPAAPPASARASNGEYRTPLAQQTQRTYVPQSVALSGPLELDWSDGEPIPDGYHRSTRVRRGPIIGGAVTFGSLYLLSILAAASAQDSARSEGSNSSPDAALYVPGIGPFIQMVSTTSATSNVVLAVDGLAQSAGIALLIYGLTSPRTILVRNDFAQAAVVPIALGREGAGLGVVGRF